MQHNVVHHRHSLATARRNLSFYTTTKHQIVCQSWEIANTDPRNVSASHRQWSIEPIEGFWVTYMLQEGQESGNPKILMQNVLDFLWLFLVKHSSGQANFLGLTQNLMFSFCSSLILAKLQNFTRTWCHKNTRIPGPYIDSSMSSGTPTHKSYRFLLLHVRQEQS